MKTTENLRKTVGPRPEICTIPYLIRRKCRAWTASFSLERQCNMLVKALKLSGQHMYTCLHTQKLSFRSTKYTCVFTVILTKNKYFVTLQSTRLHLLMEIQFVLCEVRTELLYIIQFKLMLRMVKISRRNFCPSLHQYSQRRSQVTATFHRFIQWIMAAVSPGMKQANSESDRSCLSGVQVNNDWSFTPRSHTPQGSNIQARRQSFRFVSDVQCDWQVKVCIGYEKGVKLRTSSHQYGLRLGCRFCNGDMNRNMSELQNIPSQEEMLSKLVPC